MCVRDISPRGRPTLVSMPLPSLQIRIFVIDPQPLIAAALAHLFAANGSFEVVGTAQIVEPLTLRSVCPDMILLCPQHGSTDICDMVGACRSAAPAAKICVVACHTHPELLGRVIEAGADGYTVKDTAPQELLDAVVQIHGGATYVDSRVERNPIDADSRRRPLNHLSSRETEVLKLIADGYSNREISIALSLSEKTIKNHVSRIFAKLHITARTQAVIHAIKSGIA